MSERFGVAEEVRLCPKVEGRRAHLFLDLYPVSSSSFLVDQSLPPCFFLRPLYPLLPDFPSYSLAFRS
jgi:hypothetical protein